MFKKYNLLNYVFVISILKAATDTTSINEVYPFHEIPNNDNFKHLIVLNQPKSKFLLLASENKITVNIK